MGQRHYMESGIIANVKFLDSKAEPLIQLSDMVTGAIARAIMLRIIRMPSTGNA